MARTAITITDVTRAASGVAQPTQQTGDQPNGMVLSYNDGRIIFEWNNSNAASRTVTIAQPVTQDGVSTAGKVITVGATSTVLVGPFPPAIYNQSDGTVSVDMQAASADHHIRCYHLT